MTRACLLLFLLASCSKVAPLPPPADAAPRPDAAPAPLEAEALARWYLACVARDWAGSGCLAHDVRVVDADGVQPAVEGAEAFLASMAEIRRLYPDLRYTPRLVLVNGRQIIAVTASSGRRAQDGKLTAFDLGEVLVVDASNRASRSVSYADANTLAWQLGMSDRPARPASRTPATKTTISVEQGSAEEAEHVERARLRVEAWNARDVAALEAGLAARLVFHDLPAPRDFDRAAYLAAEKAGWKAGDTWVVESTLAAGDYVAIIGKRGRVSLLEILRFERGTISEAWRFYNSP
jgi:hypothetical protein